MMVSKTLKQRELSLLKREENLISQNRKRKRPVKQINYGSTSITAPISGSSIVRRKLQIPKIITSNSSTFVCNTELANNVVGIALGAFFTVRESLYPPYVGWLSGVAVNYSKWRWVYLRAIYIPLCPTTTTGQVVLSLGYDFNDTVPTLNTAQQAYRSVSTPPWGGFEGTMLMNSPQAKPGAGSVVVDVDTSRFGSGSALTYYRFVNQTTFGAANANDKNIYCPAYLDYSTFGGPAVQATFGNIYWEYCIELIEPIAASVNA